MKHQHLENLILDCLLFPHPEAHTRSQQHSSVQGGACVSVTGYKRARLAWSSPEGPSSASGGCVALCSVPGMKSFLPVERKRAPREPAVCGANARTICSLGPKPVRTVGNVWIQIQKTPNYLNIFVQINNLE